MGFVLNNDWKVGSRVIDNVPSADELRIVSLRLYFKAWAEASSMNSHHPCFAGQSSALQTNSVTFLQSS
jgi:hypothetical protein